MEVLIHGCGKSLLEGTGPVISGRIEPKPPGAAYNYCYRCESGLPKLGAENLILYIQSPKDLAHTDKIFHCVSPCTFQSPPLQSPAQVEG